MCFSIYKDSKNLLIIFYFCGQTNNVPDVATVSEDGTVTALTMGGYSYMYKNGELLYTGGSWAFDPYCVVE